MRLSIAGRIVIAFLMGAWISGCAKPLEDVSSEADAKSGNNETERVQAGVGVGAKGRNTGGGLVSEPIGVYFDTKERLTFMRLEQAMQLYKAPTGKGPATHEAFMEEIIKANRIELPKLPDGHRYVYDPETEQLMVERPAE